MVQNPIMNLVTEVSMQVSHVCGIPKNLTEDFTDLFTVYFT
jgi:hypothetical protein